jgi:hypothetical protein
MRRLFALCFLAMAAWAAPQASPQSIIVNPIPTSLQVRAWVNLDPSGTGNPVYTIGSPITIYAQVNQPAYVYLFDINADGRIDLILPNSYDQNNYLQPGTVYQFPAPGAPYTFTVTGPPGQDRLLAVASLSPLPLGGIADLAQGKVKIRGAERLAHALSIVVTPLPQTSWVSDIVFFRVQGESPVPPPPPPPPAFGFLQVTSSPEGAQVLLNGTPVGQTPLSLSVAPGPEQVVLQLPGYQTYSTRLFVHPGQRLTIEASLIPLLGTLSVNAQPNGSSVFLDGRFVGTTPLSLSLGPGGYEVRITHPGYFPYQTRVEVQGGQVARIQAQLRPLEVSVNLYLNTSALVFLNGRSLGSANGGFLRITAPPGTYEVTLVAPGFHTYVFTLRLPANQSDLYINLSPL